ncbi:MAG: hypothetical protein MI742_14000 [Desulfobacterales bacterium]|nr:hypothetical protein [Desulfobacterales bacterium]
MMQEARPHLSTVFSSAHEDFKTLLCGARFDDFQKKVVLGQAGFETWLALLSDGSKLADFKIKRQNFTLERHSIYVKEGLLGFFSATSKGVRSGFVYRAELLKAEPC